MNQIIKEILLEVQSTNNLDIKKYIDKYGKDLYLKVCHEIYENNYIDNLIVVNNQRIPYIYFFENTYITPLGKIFIQSN